MIGNKIDPRELEELRQEMYTSKYDAGIYGVATLLMIVVAIYTWCKLTFVDSLPLFIGAMLSLTITTTKYKYFKMIQAYIELAELISKKISELENNN